MHGYKTVVFFLLYWSFMTSHTSLGTVTCNSTDWARNGWYMIVLSIGTLGWQWPGEWWSKINEPPLRCTHMGNTHRRPCLVSALSADVTEHTRIRCVILRYNSWRDIRAPTQRGESTATLLEALGRHWPDMRLLYFQQRYSQSPITQRLPLLLPREFAPLGTSRDQFRGFLVYIPLE